MKIFGLRIEKDRRSEVNAYALNATEVTLPADYAMAYGVDTYAFSAIDLIAASMIRATWYVRDTDGNILKRKDAPHLYRLLEFPNTFMPWSTFISYEIRDLLARGNAFMEVSRSSGDIQFHRLVPGRITIIVDPKEYISHYEYEVNEKVINYNKKEVIFLRLADPNNENIGTGPLEIASKDIRLRGYTKLYLKAFFKNGTILSGIIATKYPLSEEEFTKLKRKIEGEYSGAGNMFRLFIMDSNEISKVELGSKMTDIPFDKLDPSLQTSILAAFRVPTALIGGEGNATKASAIAISGNFWNSVVIPYLILFRDSVNQRLADSYPSKRIDFDISKIPEIQSYFADISEKVSRLILVRTIKVDEGRAMLGLPPLENGMGDCLLTPQNESLEYIKGVLTNGT